MLGMSSTMCTQFQASLGLHQPDNAQSAACLVSLAMTPAPQHTSPVRQVKICQQSALKLPCVLKGKQGLLAAVASRRKLIAMQNKP